MLFRVQIAEPEPAQKLVKNLNWHRNRYLLKVETETVKIVTVPQHCIIQQVAQTTGCGMDFC